MPAKVSVGWVHWTGLVHKNNNSWKVLCGVLSGPREGSLNRFFLRMSRTFFWRESPFFSD